VEDWGMSPLLYISKESKQLAMEHALGKAPLLFSKMLTNSKSVSVLAVLPSMAATVSFPGARA
jgi:hypothetical protein